MKRKYIIPCIIIICLGFGILLGIIIYRNNLKTNDNTEKNYKKSYIESTYKIDELEKENEELKKNQEDSDETKQTYSNSLEDNKKTTQELLDIIERADFKENEYQYIVDDVMDKFYRYAFTMHALPYCGEHGEDEFIDNGQYRESYTFKNKAEVKDFFLEFLSKDYYNNNIKEHYLEKNNKLYCYTPGRGALLYKPEESDFKVIAISDNKIEVFAKTISENIGTDTKIAAYAVLIKENGNWVVDEYKEFY